MAELTSGVLDILTLGEPLMELSEQGHGRYQQGFGGDVSNVAVAAARQGASVGIVTRLGDDAFGDRFMGLWAAEGIDARWVERSATESTGTYLISYENGDHRFTYYRRSSAASRLGPDSVPREAIAMARTVHLSGITEAISTSACDATLHALDLAREQGKTVAFDPNMRAALWPLPRARALLLATAAMVDICLPSLEDARALLGPGDPDTLADRLLALGSRAVVLKLGADGVLVASGAERTRIAGHQVDLVDATGAGDTLDGALLAELARGATLPDAARYANAAAALATRGKGAVGPIPHRPDVTAFLSAVR